tara:strand:+ start:193 stop:1350 length:1158 start_codon:yes stop_codon:yes gene_type:complete
MATQEGHRILSLKLARERYPAEYTERYIIYRGDKLSFTDEMFNELLPLIPEVWNTDKDRLTHFVLFEDGTYMCVRDKDIYNYSRKESESKTYFYNSATDNQVAQIVKIVTDYFGKAKLKEVENFYDDVMNSLSDMSYVKNKMLEMRAEALRRSDYMFNRDYVIADADLETKWKTYRQEWRDITETEAWVNNDLMNLSIPLSPSPQETSELALEGLRQNLANLEVTDQLLDDMKVSVDCSLYENSAKKFGEVSFKLEVLKTLSKLKIPFNNNITTSESADQLETLDANLSAVNVLPQDIYTRYQSIKEVESDTNDASMKAIADEQLTDIDAKIEAINAKLQEYNVDFSIGDIMTKFVEDTKARIESIEATEEAERLVYELEGDSEE